MRSNESSEDYLETILILGNRSSLVRAVDIAAEMGFCERHIYRLHKAAVEELDNRLKDVM